MEKTNDDGRRGMPKLKWPYGNHRFADVADRDIRNDSMVFKLSDKPHADFIFECPKCHQLIGLSIKRLHINMPSVLSNITAASRGESISSSRQ